VGFLGAVASVIQIRSHHLCPPYPSPSLGMSMTQKTDGSLRHVGYRIDVALGDKGQVFPAIVSENA